MNEYVYIYMFMPSKCKYHTVFVANSHYSIEIDRETPSKRADTFHSLNDFTWNVIWLCRLPSEKFAFFSMFSPLSNWNVRRKSQFRISSYFVVHEWIFAASLLFVFIYCVRHYQFHFFSIPFHSFLPLKTYPNEKHKLSVLRMEKQSAPSLLDQSNWNWCILV